MTATKTSSNILKLTQFSVLLAIEAIFCFTPLGSLPALGPIVATLAGVPVVVTAAVLGTAAGTLMGFFAGLFSLTVWTFMPANPAMAFLFSPFYSLGELHGNFGSLLICFVPRILIGFITGTVFSGMKKVFKGKKELTAYAVSGALGSFANTFFVLGGIYLFFGKSYAALIGKEYAFVLGALGSIVLTSGIPEAVICALSTSFIARPIRKYILKERF